MGLANEHAYLQRCTRNAGSEAFPTIIASIALAFVVLAQGTRPAARDHETRKRHPLLDKDADHGFGRSGERLRPLGLVTMAAALPRK